MIDKVVSAEIPDKDQDPNLYELMTTHMIHGPCGFLNQSAICMFNGKRTKDYPKDFRTEKVEASDDYPKYQSRNMNSFLRDGNTIDSRLVVPYNPYLLRK